jgi:hypothetical protein
MDVLALFRQEGQQLFWHRLTDGRVLDRPSGEPIRADEAYVVVRLAGMYLGRSRVLWRKLSPLVHAFVGYGNGSTQHAVAGPGQLQDLGEANLDRVIVLNARLVGPVPYKGGELTLLAGLYSIPRGDAAAALLNTLSALSNIVGPEVATAAKIAGVVKAGVDSILSLNTAQLRLGVSDTFGGGGNELRSGFHVGIGAPQPRVAVDRLWFKDGTLSEGSSAVLAQPYVGTDYFVVQLERLERRVDWPGLPGLAEFEQRFGEVLKGAGDVAAKRAELSAIWPRFTETLVSSPHLTRFDAGQIANEVKADLRGRVDALDSGGLFETRGWGTDRKETYQPADIDFGLVPTLRATPDEGELSLQDPAV